MTSCAIIGTRSPQRSVPGEALAKDGPGSACNGKEVMKLVPVRDYKDRAILRGLQTAARSENPGFVWFDENKEKAKLAWIRRGRYGEVAGYCIYKEWRYEYSAYAGRDVHVPRHISQIFVIGEQRRRSVASSMIKDFVSAGKSATLWVESPTRETMALLHKIGFKESRERYQLWEMMFGLTCWTREVNPNNVILPVDQGLDSGNCHEPWLWSGDSPLEMAMLR